MDSAGAQAGAIRLAQGDTRLYTRRQGDTLCYTRLYGDYTAEDRLAGAIQRLYTGWAIRWCYTRRLVLYAAIRRYTAASPI